MIAGSACTHTHAARFVSTARVLAAVAGCRPPACRLVSRRDGIDGPHGAATIAWVAIRSSAGLDENRFVAVTRAGRLRWSSPDDAVLGSRVTGLVTDRTGNLFASVATGAHGAEVVVLRAGRGGVDDFGSLDPDTPRFLGDIDASALDVDHDGRREIVVTNSDYDPDFAHGHPVLTVYRWNGHRYVTDRSAHPG